jgi:SAM-dependent methyltransferase
MTSPPPASSTVTPDAALAAILRCPRCKQALSRPSDDAMVCADAGCGQRYPVVAGRPVLIDEQRSVFAIADYKAPDAEKPDDGVWARVRAAAKRVPTPSINQSAERCFAWMRDRLAARSGGQLVLVVGGGVMGKGMHVLHEVPAIRLVNVDPSPDSAANLFCDAHDLPFADASVDAVVAQAVLEHVADPLRCVAEIHRVLKPDGIVYSEIPFMQEVHLRGYDFTRFTLLGHRRLFREFKEAESGAVAGPGTTLAWAWRYFLASFARSRAAAKVLFWIGRVTGFVLEQTDHLLRTPGALDAASCTFFLGTKATCMVSDRDLIASYRGGQR